MQVPCPKSSLASKFIPLAIESPSKSAAQAGLRLKNSCFTEKHSFTAISSYLCFH